ncbi:hypothetical protein [Marinitoga lauensis]|uniref:hypothetical protein n=1 Tax=Marinitoga lauensis TaxID=2201189 RepID=UPI00101131DF|nr:hypothetical protein [Marinitoga lauensis]
MYTFKLPYNKLFSDNNVLKLLQKNLSSGIEKVNIPSITDDSFQKIKKSYLKKLLLKKRKRKLFLKSIKNL